MYQIQTNASGSRQMFITEQHLETIRRYTLLRDLIDSHGIITESVLDKLKLNVRSLIEAEEDNADLLALCSEVLFHDNMKAFGLHQLVTLYINWVQTRDELDSQIETD